MSLVEVRRAAPWATLGAVALVALLAAAPPAWSDALALHRDTWGAQPWRLWTAHIVHYGAVHAFADALGLLVCGAVVERLAGTRAWLVGWCAALPLLSLGVLMAEPGLAQYRGASGAVMALAAAAGGLLWREQRVSRAWLAAAAAVLLLKLVWDIAAGAGASPVLPQGVRPAWSAHVGGALLGLAWGLLWRRGHPAAGSPRA